AAPTTLSAPCETIPNKPAPPVRENDTTDPFAHASRTARRGRPCPFARIGFATSFRNARQGRFSSNVHVAWASNSPSRARLPLSLYSEKSVVPLLPLRTHRIRRACCGLRRFLALWIFGRGNRRK